MNLLKYLKIFIHKVFDIINEPLIADKSEGYMEVYTRKIMTTKHALTHETRLFCVRV